MSIENGTCDDCGNVVGADGLNEAHDGSDVCDRCLAHRAEDGEAY